jgi:transglutaminase-like putative cysteine protease
VTPGHGRPRPPSALRSLLGSALVAAAACASLLALSGLLAPGRWLGAALLAVLALAIVTASVRSVARSRWAPTLAGAIVAAVGLLVAYGGPPERVQIVPDGASLDRLATAVRAAFTLINASVVPMEAARPVELLVVAGGVLVFLVADALALGLGAPAWSGLAFATMWLPAIGLGFPAPVSALGWTALAYTLLLALSAAPHADRGAGVRRTLSTVAIAIALVAATLVAGPLVTAAPGWASLTLPNFGTGPSGTLRLSTNLDMRQSLGQRSGQVVLHYMIEGPGSSPATTGATTGPTPATTSPGVLDAQLIGPLRAFTLQDFDGRNWQPTPTTNLQQWRPSTLLSSDPQLQGSSVDPQVGTLARVDVTIDNLRDLHLPVSTFPRTVQVQGPWRYDTALDEVVGDRATAAGTTYSMTVEVPHLTADQLRAASGPPPASVQSYLAVPQTAHADQVRALAAQITAGAQDPYDQALALQTYFRDPTRFVYDTKVAPARTDDSVWDFLQNRHGYCVQFATSMAIMARSLGIPARLGVGFLPGVRTNNGSYTVTGRLSHAWPELYFPGSGWVRFEPTPAVQTGAPPSWSDPAALSNAAPGAPALNNGAPDPVNRGGNTAPTATTAATTVNTATSSSRVGTGVIVLAVLVLLVGAVVVLRRRSDRDVHVDPEVAWTRLRDRLRAAGIDWSDARTPRQSVDLVRNRVIELRGIALGDEADSALVQLADALERQRYAPLPPTVQAEELEAWIGTVLTDLTTALSDRPRPGASASAPRGGS